MIDSHQELKRPFRLKDSFQKQLKNTASVVALVVATTLITIQIAYWSQGYNEAQKTVFQDTVDQWLMELDAACEDFALNAQ